MNIKKLYSLYISDAISYDDLLEQIEADILEKIDDGDYHGDSYVLFYDKKNKNYGVLVFGWGSCPGCDALESCDSFKDVLSLYKELKRDIKWFEDKEQVIEYLQSEEREYEHSWHDDAYHVFVKKVIKRLKK